MVVVGGAVREAWVQPLRQEGPHCDGHERTRGTKTSTVDIVIEELSQKTEQGHSPQHLLLSCLKYLRPTKPLPDRCLSRDGVHMSEEQTHGAWCQAVRSQCKLQENLPTLVKKDVTSRLKQYIDRSK